MSRQSPIIAGVFDCKTKNQEGFLQLVKLGKQYMNFRACQLAQVYIDIFVEKYH